MNSEYSTDLTSQRQRLLARPQTGTITTLEAREQGHKIVTHRTTGRTDKAKHRVACYALLARVGGV